MIKKLYYKNKVWIIRFNKFKIIYYKKKKLNKVNNSNFKNKKIKNRYYYKKKILLRNFIHKYKTLNLKILIL